MMPKREVRLVSVVAVTGCSGYIGSRLQRFLDEDDTVSKVVGVDINLPTFDSPKLEFHRLDVRDRVISSLFREKGVDRVVHLAFVMNPIHDEALMHDIDLGGAANVLAATDSCGASQLVVASSTTAFGAFPDNPQWLTEEDPVRRFENYYYSADKYDVEMMLQQFDAGHPAVKVAVVRPCFVFGPNIDNFVSRFILRLPVIPGLGGARPDLQFVHEDDAAEVFMRVLEKRAAGRFHAVGEGTVNLSRIAELAGKRILDLPPALASGAVNVLWRLHAPLIEGPAGMLDFIRHRWTATDAITREKLGIVSMRTSEEVLRLMLESKGVFKQ
jgi:UDP-glucose 4-epimerase